MPRRDHTGRLRTRGPTPTAPVNGGGVRLGRRLAGSRRWVRVDRGTATPRPVERFTLVAVVNTYLEADIIGATVANARRQGCDRVLLVDNDSPDDTVARAVEAGAELGARYASDSFDLARSVATVHHLMRATADAVEGPLWWLLLDADELPHGPGGRTLRQYLASLDRRCNVVGARVFNHFPSGPPALVAGRHPLDTQPLCQEVRLPQCPLGHWKHPLLRWDPGAPPVLPRGGQHRAFSEGPLREPRQGVFIHHFQYRDPDVTRRRLAALCAPGPGGAARNDLNDERQGRPSGITQRWRHLDAVYEGRWEAVARVTPRGAALGVDPRPWADLVDPADATVARWY